MLALVALVASALATTAPWAAAPASAAPGDPFDPADPLVFVGQNQPTGLFRAVTNAAGEVEFEDEGPPSPVTYNALAYNTADNYLYAIVNAGNATYPQGSLVQIGEAGTLTRVGTETFQNSLVGAFGDDGLMYSTFGAQDEIQVIDTSTGTLAQTLSLSQPMYTTTVGGPDFALLDGYLWSAGSGGITRTDPSTGTVDYFPGVIDESLAIAGAAWTFGNGNLGFSFNSSGTVVQIAVESPGSADPTFTEISRGPGPSSTNNDGAASPGQPTDLSIVKEGPEALVAGSTIEYTLTVTNNGPGNSSGFTVSDTIPATLTNASTPDVDNCDVDGSTFTCRGGRTLAGESVEFTIVADVPADLAPDAELANTATVVPNEEDPTPGNNTSTSTGEAASIDLVKEVAEIEDVNDNGLTDAGDVITYEFTVTNTGLVELTDIAVDDPLLTEPAECPVTTLAPGEDTVCDATYTITEDDEAGTSVDNTATAGGTTPDDQTVTSEPSTTSTELEAPAPALTLVKSATPTDLDQFDPGQEITYSFLVTNTGNVTVEDIAIDEGEFSGSGPLADPVCEETMLAPEGETLCTTVYTLTEEDILEGGVSNTATATGTPPGEPPVESPPSEFELPAPAQPSLTVVKSATPEIVDAEGDVITYSFLVTNTGNLTLSDVGIAEQEFSGTGDLSAIECPDTTLAPQGTTTCVATYEVTQADIDSGDIDNTATAEGTPPGAEEPISSEPSSANVFADRTPGLALVKSVDPADAETYVADQEITYSFLVTNTGNVTLENVDVTDTEFSGTGELGEITCTDGAGQSFAPEDTFTCEATYTLTQEDIDAGEITNTAISSGNAPGDDFPVESDPSTVELDLPAQPALTVVKTASPEVVSAEGEEITYSFLVTNTGNVTLTDVEVIEGEFSGTGDLGEITCPDGAGESLAPEDTFTCEATYLVTQADVDAGEITNTATAGGTPPGSDEPIESDPSTSTVAVEQTPALSMVKSASPSDVDSYEVDQAITYSFLVTNTGNVTLTDVEVVELEFTGTGDLSEITCPDGAGASLAPEDTFTCEATYVVTQADVDAGGIANLAGSTGTPPAGDPVDSPPSLVELPIPAEPGLSVEKSAAPESVGAEGEEITYSFLVTNTGNVTLSDVSITEQEFSGTGDLSAIECPAATLAPEATTTCSATYVVTQADVDAGEITNTATAGGTPPGSEEPVGSEPSTSTVGVDQTPELALTKTSDADDLESLAAGEEITYTFLVTNTGNVTMTDVEVVEGEFTGTGDLGEVTCPDGAGASLAPGETFECTASYTLTQEDVDTGSVENTATATGFPPGSEEPIESPPSTVTIPPVAEPGLTVVKSSDTVSVQQAGHVITYSFLVTNVGNVTISDVTVEEGDFTGAGELEPVTCPAAAASLAPGDEVTCTTTYEVVEADLDGGQISNTATAGGLTPGGDPVTSAESTTTTETADQLPATGSSILPIVAIALLLVGGGVALAVVRRRSTR
ncbi:DUF11 domain-containing protein [Ruania suaedae]|uniref:DUF11 domain-containing protein n=1 Tax=Ruania suaedae TaxID=2897774 RepID=UPI001E545B96|nr:DUF11 domain-containing protein [Ruania suaedae]UFU02799.1 DUF11 domain-containing protein [Ruania suaedae]